MKGLLTAVVAVLRASAGWVAAVLSALARGAGASARVTAAGARALGQMLLPAMKAGAARAGGGVKRSIFALPGLVLKTVRGKIVEVLVTLGLTAGIAYWISDAQVIRNEPIACWFSDTMSELVGAREPMAQGSGFRVLVAQLDGDEGGVHTRNVALSIERINGFEVRELCGSLGVPKGMAMAEGWRAAEARAREILAAWHADIIIWGMPAPDNSVRLYRTTPAGTGGLELYEMSRENGYLLSADFNEDFVAQVQASVLSGIAMDAKGLPTKYSDLLAGQLPRLRALALARAGSPYSDVSIAGLYVVAFQRVMYEDLRLGRPARLKPEDLLAVADGLALAFDPARQPNDWASVASLEALVKLQVFSVTGQVPELRATAEQFERIARAPNIDPRIVPPALVGAAVAWQKAAAVLPSAELMYRALGLADEARKRGLGPRDAFFASANETFAGIVQWLARNAGDNRRVEEAIEAATMSLEAGGGFDDGVGGGRIRATLLLADLQVALALKTRDEALHRQAIAAFDRVVTPETAKLLRDDHLMGLEQRFDALESLARATGKDADYARAIAEATSARATIMREQNPQAYAALSRRRGQLMGERGVAAKDPAQVKAAIADLNTVLEGVSQETLLADWCALRATIAQGTWSLAELEKAAGGYDQALDIMREAETAARRANPQLWSQMRAERARMLEMLGFEREEVRFLREAADLRRANAAERDLRKAAPGVWADRQHALGETLLAVGDLSRDAGSFAAAANAFKAALEEHARERNEPLWLRSQAQLTVALARQGEASGARPVLEQAIAAADEALTVQAPAGDLDVVMVRRARALAQTALAFNTKDAALAVAVRAEMKKLVDALDPNTQRVEWAWARLRYGAAGLIVGALNADEAATAEGAGAIVEAGAVGEKIGNKTLVRAAEATLDKAPRAKRK